jgi:2-phosphosulfolactate phosphatase
VIPSVRVAAFHGGPVDAGDGMVCVGIDVLRAATTAVTALASGARCFPVASLEAARRRACAMPGAILAGELHGQTPPGFSLSNSPVAVQDLPSRAPVVLLSTSGTPLFVAAAESGTALVACLRNWRATVDALGRMGRDVLLLGAASGGEFRDEDQLCAAWIAGALLDLGYAVSNDPTADLIREWRDRTVDRIRQSASALFLERTAQQADLEFVLAHVGDVDSAAILDRSEVILAAAGGAGQPGGVSDRL